MLAQMKLSSVGKGIHAASYKKKALGVQNRVSFCSLRVTYRENDRMKVLDVFSWLPAKEISIDELKQIFMEHLNGTYVGEYEVLLETPDNADKNILNSRAELIEEGKDVAYILKGGNVIAVVGYQIVENYK